MQPYSFNQRIENLFKSYFSAYKNIDLTFGDSDIKIHIIDKQNLDSASLELKKNEGCYEIVFWDGYSHSDTMETLDEKNAEKILKHFMKKLLKIINS